MNEMITPEHDQSHAPYILFITGVSAAGKTTVYEALEGDKILNNVHLRDIDEDGVPKVGKGLWRQFRVEELLYEAHEAAKDGSSTVICGIAKPSEVIESKYYTPDSNVHFILLDIPYDLFEARIQGRIDAIRQKGEHDEVFDPSNFRELCVATESLMRVLKNSVISVKNGYVLDGQALSPETMIHEVKKIIGKLS